MKPSAALLLTLLSLSPVAQAATEHLSDAGQDPVPAAQAQARERKLPLFVDFHAPWCYSCYFMASHVQTGPEWERASARLVRVELDADSPAGARWMKEWSVKAMPTYIVFDAEGRERGRVLGEKTRAEFYAWLDAALGGDTLEALRAKVTDGSEASLVAARETLGAFHARYDAAGGLAWYQGLPPKVRAAIARDPRASAWVARLELLRAANEKDVPACLNVAPAVLAAPLGCERPYELSRVMACTEGQPRRDPILRSQVEPMTRLLEKQVVAGGRCADERSVVTGAADLHQALGDPVAEKQVLERAIADVTARIGDKLGADRNLADNLRVYLDRAGRTEELDRLFPKLIAAFPDDYVYAFRQGKSLAQRGRHADALPLFEQADAKAYGVNKLRNAEWRAKSLVALNRSAEARAVLAVALKDNGAFFPDDAARIETLLATLAPAAP